MCANGAAVGSSHQLPTSPLEDALARYWGYTTFRPLQREAMEAVLERRDSLVVLPTGGGKSLCFQAPALVRPGLAVVVSPLISLMKDQVDTLVGNGVPAGLYNSSLTQPEKAPSWPVCARVATACSMSRPSGWSATAATAFLRSSPHAASASLPWTRRTASASGGTTSGRNTVSWRGSASGCPGISVHAYTATATARVRRDIATQLGLLDPIELVGSFDRPNLVYRVLPRAALKRQLLDVLARHRAGGGHHLLHVAARGRCARGVADRRRHPGTSVSRGPRRGRAHAGTRTPSPPNASTSSSPRSPSAWASIGRTCGSSCTRARRDPSSTISRSRAARDATVSRPSAC